MKPCPWHGRTHLLVEEKEGRHQRVIRVSVGTLGTQSRVLSDTDGGTGGEGSLP